jgi:hypothetical protein
MSFKTIEKRIEKCPRLRGLFRADFLGFIVVRLTCKLTEKDLKGHFAKKGRLRFPGFPVVMFFFIDI